MEGEEEMWQRNETAPEEKVCSPQGMTVLVAVERRGRVSWYLPPIPHPIGGY